MKKEQLLYDTKYGFNQVSLWQLARESHGSPTPPPSSASLCSVSGVFTLYSWTSINMIPCIIDSHKDSKRATIFMKCNTMDILTFAEILFTV